MIKYFKKPYPLIIEDGYLFPSLVDLLIGVIVFGVLYLFEPSLFFDPPPVYTINICLFFGAIAFIIPLFYTNILPRIFTTTFSSKKWTIGREFIFQASIILTIAILNYFLYIVVFQSGSSINYNHLIQMILSTMVIAFIPLMIVTIILQQHNFNKMMKGSGELNNALSTSEKNATNSKLICFAGDGKNERIELLASNIVYIESSANYCDICYLCDDKLEKTTFRMSLANIVNLLADYPSLIKTHRSYIVNLNHIIKVKGNAQGYQLTLTQLNGVTIPVSRANVSKLDDSIKK